LIGRDIRPCDIESSEARAVVHDSSNDSADFDKHSGAPTDEEFIAPDEGTDNLEGEAGDEGDGDDAVCD
jgi:hypothetical protein